MTSQRKQACLLFKQFILLFILCFLYKANVAQVRVRGFVYDESGVFPLEAVSVLSSSGNGSLSDSAGYYSLSVQEKDSIWFSYLGKETQRFAIADIPNLNDFVISLRVNVQMLKEVRVKPADRHYDSVQNRIEYAKVFEYKKPSFHSVVKSISITGFVVDINELIRVFQYREKRMMLGFQKRLIEDEQQQYISYKFTKSLVFEITGLKGAMLDSFMLRYRPSYSFITIATDYSLRKYIKDNYENNKQYLLTTKKPDEVQ